MENISLDEWVNSLINRNIYWKSGSIQVTGERFKHLGGMTERASATILFKVYEKFEIIFPGEFTQEEVLFSKSFIFGVLDSLTLCDRVRFGGMSIIVENISIDPICSTVRAFRFAGRDAGNKIADYINKLRNYELP